MKRNHLPKRELACLVATVLVSYSVGATEFPNKPVTIVTPFPAGSSSDLIPRMLAPLVSKSLGVPIIIDNRPGANGSLGAAAVAHSAADGYTLLLGTTGVMSINQWIYQKPRYLAERDFMPITNAASTPNILVVHPRLPVSNLKELVALAKARPGKLSYASAGNGSTSHLCGEVLKSTTGTNMVHVPYKGPAPALQDLLGGSIDWMCDNFSNVMNHIRSGTLKAIALTDEKRSPLLPEVSTTVEQGFPQVIAGNWYGFAAPVATPRPIVDKLHAAFSEALKDSQVQQKLHGLGLTTVADTPEAFKSQIAKDSLRMKAIVLASGARVE